MAGKVQRIKRKVLGQTAGKFFQIFNDGRKVLKFYEPAKPIRKDSDLEKVREIIKEGIR